jgi:hypothetical protein
MPKMNYDRDADVLYISFGHSEHVTGVELADNILLRLDTGKATEEAPRAMADYCQFLPRDGIITHDGSSSRRAAGDFTGAAAQSVARFMAGSGGRGDDVAGE